MENKEKALKYAGAGLKIFPLWWIDENTGKCACNDKNCGGPGSQNNPGKHPIAGSEGKWIVPKGRLDSTSDLKKVDYWWTQYPKANIALDCSGNGLFVIDIDRHVVKGVEVNGFEALDDFETTFKEKITSTISAETGGGGVHLIFKAPGDFKSAPSGLGSNYPGVDFKFNGYILLSPSNHKSGNKYQWTEESEELLLSKDFPPLPRSIENLIRDGFDDKRFSPERFTVTARDVDSDDLDQIKEALDYLNFHSLNDDERLKVGMGLQSLLPGGMGKQLYFDWLRQHLGGKFSYKLCERRWRSFKYRSGGRTIASFFELAMEFGFENTGKQGVYVDPSDHVKMQPTKVADFVDESKNCLFVQNEVPLPMHVDFEAMPEVMIIDFSCLPEIIEQEMLHAKKTNNINYVDESRIEAVSIMNSSNSKSMKMLQSLFEKGRNKDPNAGMPDESEFKSWFERLGNRQVLCDLFRWQAQNSSTYVPEIAASFTLSVLGALLAGRFSYGTLTTNLYFMVIADTSVGKSQTVKMAKKVLECAYDHNRIGPKDIVSDKGFYNDLVKDKGRYFMLDEIGELFANIFHERANVSQKMIRRAILDGYTSYGEKTNVTASKADAKNNAVVDLGGICPSIYGLTTPGKIYEAFSGSDIIDGLLSRFQVLNSIGSGNREGKIPMNTTLPESVGVWINRVKSIYTPQMYVQGQENVTAMTIDADSKELEIYIKSVETARKREAGKYAGIWGRLTENTLRTAMVFELAERPYSTSIKQDSLLYAYQFVSWCAEKSEEMARNHITDSKEQSVMREVNDFISSQPKGATLQAISENTRLGGDVKNRRLIIQTLKSEQKIKEFEYRSKPGQRGRGTMVYFTYQTWADFCDTTAGESFIKKAVEK